MTHPAGSVAPGAAARATLLYLAWLVAMVATIGSLWFSEVMGFVPCTLCWYQRILMYPLAIVLGIGAWRGEQAAVRYALPFPLLGAVVSAYHIGVQKIPGFGFPAACRAGVPCDVEYIQWFGFVTIPVLALTAFLLIAALLATAARSQR